MFLWISSKICCTLYCLQRICFILKRYLLSFPPHFHFHLLFYNFLTSTYKLSTPSKVAFVLILKSIITKFLLHFYAAKKSKNVHKVHAVPLLFRITKHFFILYCNSNFGKYYSKLWNKVGNKINKVFPD